MTDRPIIFSVPMVRALRDGRKTMTRRLAWAPWHLGALDFSSEELEDFDARGWSVRCRGPDDLYYVSKPSPWQRVRPGDRLWVRENFVNLVTGPIYAADGPTGAARVTPCIHMPRSLSRLTLTVTAARVERLQGITEEEAFAEGVQLSVYRREDGSIGRLIPVSVKRPPNAHTAREFFASLWCELHGKEAWDANPEVVALTFAANQSNIDALQVAA